MALRNGTFFKGNNSIYREKVSMKERSNTTEGLDISNALELCTEIFH